jgi:hypothetical protein
LPETLILDPAVVYRKGCPKGAKGKQKGKGVTGIYLPSKTLNLQY